MTSTTLSVRHNFETGHRLPFLPGKCESLHGHSWWVEVTIEAPGHHHLLIEFGKFKKGLRDWVDLHLDHGLMLGDDDLLVGLLSEHGKVYRFGSAPFTQDLAWPTVENVAALLARVADEVLRSTTRAPGCRVVEVQVSETHVNKAGWRLGSKAEGER